MGSFEEKNKITLDKQLLEDPIVKELAKSPYKEITENTSRKRLRDDSSKSGGLGNLKKVSLKKEDQTLEYYKKKYTNSKPIDETNSSLSLQELIAGSLYRITGCKSPKQKVFLKINPSKTTYHSRMDSGSKEVNFEPLKSKNELLTNLMLWQKESNYKALEECGRLMGGVLALGDYDRNRRNYYYDKNDGLLGKMDHDRTFQEPMNDHYKYADPNFILHVFFIEALCKKSSLLDPDFRQASQNFELNIRKAEDISRYSSFRDGLFHLDKSKGEWNFNPQFFDNKTLESLKNKKFSLFIFVALLKSVQNFIQMPKEIKEHLFLPKNLLGDAWEQLPAPTKTDLRRHSAKLLMKFEKNIQEINSLFSEPIKILDELESILLSKGMPLPRTSVNYDGAVKFIQKAKENNMTLCKLKESMKASVTPKKNKDLGMFR